MLIRGDGVGRGVLPGKGVLAGPVWEGEDGSSENILPIEDRGR